MNQADRPRLSIDAPSCTCGGRHSEHCFSSEAVVAASDSDRRPRQHDARESTAT